MNQPAPDSGVPSSSESWFRGLSKRAFRLTLVVGILFIGMFTFGALAQLKQDPARKEPVVKVYRVEVFPIRRIDLPENFPAYGTALADRDVVITAKVAGDIVLSAESERSLKVGQRVKPNGLLMFQIDPTTYRQKVKQAKLQVKLDDKELMVLRKEKENNLKLLVKATQDLADYRLEYLRIERAKKRGVAAESELTKAKLELQRYETLQTRAQNTRDLFPVKEEQIEARKEHHLAQQRLAEIDLGHTRVAVPFAGVLSKIDVEPGEYVRVGDPLARLTNASIVEIPMALSLDDFAKIERLVRSAKTDDERPFVKIAESEAGPFQWSGHIVRVAPEADEVTRTIKVYIRVINTAQSSRNVNGHGVVVPKMHYYGLIQGPVLRHVIVVPRDAITDNRVFVAAELKKTSKKGTGNNAEKRATTMYDGVVQERKITILRTIRNLAVIETGLREGEFVILTNLDVIHTGARVRFPQSQIRTLKDELGDQHLPPRAAANGNGTVKPISP